VNSRVRMAVLASRLDGIVLRMMNTLVRTGRSGVLNTARDFSCCILTADHELLAMAESQPIHVLSGPDLMARSMIDLHPELSKGDAFLHNCPYHGNSHAADHSILVPVMDRDSRHRFTVLAKAHQADCGNSVPTTFAAAARDVYEEGALIFPCVRVQTNYRDNEDVIRMCEQRIRVAEQWRGDYLALLGSARIGERQLMELADELSWTTLEEHAGEWFDYSERRMAGAVSRLPSGSIAVETAHDPFPGVPDGIPISVGIQVFAESRRIEVDLRDNPDNVPCGLNLSEATARTAAMLGVFNAIGAEVPPNAGSFRRVDVLLREGCVVGIPRHPASCSVATTNLADRVASAVQRGIAELCEGAGMAEVGPTQPAAWAVISGHDPREHDRPFVNQLILSAVTGGAGSPVADGWLSLGGIGDAGMMFRDSVELDELRFPIRVIEQRIVPDTEGAGRFRGVPSALVEYGPVGTELEVLFASDGSSNPAKGARGGHQGSPAHQYRRRADGTLDELPPYARVSLSPGETIVSVSAAGGGYGPPRERAAEMVRHDVAEGWISPERARDVYGTTPR
jgi:N-methylhydantoinase B